MIEKKRPVFIVAEISANHGQDFNRAASLIKEAKECGADAVKFQLYSPETMTIDADNKYFRIKHPRWGGQTLYQLYRKACTPWSWFSKLKKLADDLEITFFSTAFDKTAVDFLEDLGVGMHKIASFELVDLGLIKYAAGTGKPIILSTGMASLSEIGEALHAARGAGARDITLLRCVSSYPADPGEMNLNTIPDMEKRFGCPIGFSDHSLSAIPAIAAVSLGARLVEKHLTLSRKVKTEDGFFSIEPKEFKEMAGQIRLTEKALGRVRYGPTKDEKSNRIFRRSLFVVKDVKKGECFTEENVRSIRPGYGLDPKDITKLLKKRAAVDLKAGTPVSTRHVMGL